jgi:AraC family transcriptional regulator
MPGATVFPVFAAFCWILLQKFAARVRVCAFCDIVEGMKHRSAPKPKPPRTPAAQSRGALIAAIGTEIVRFQDASNRVDDAAAAVLALERADLQCVSMLLFMGAAPAERLVGALRLTPRAFRSMIERIELAGYARRVMTREGDRVELTDHARRWVETLWGPLAAEGTRLLELESTRDLAVLARFMETIRPVQEAHAARIRALLEVPSASAPSNRVRGGLSPAALRRVQLFIEANLERTIHLSDLAERAGLSEFHFARSFKTSMGTTPRAFLENRRIEKAQELLRESDLSLAQIAAETGLGTQSRFTTTFRRATGFTPATYRRGKP